MENNFFLINNRHDYVINNNVSQYNNFLDTTNQDLNINLICTDNQTHEVNVLVLAKDAKKEININTSIEGSHNQVKVNLNVICINANVFCKLKVTTSKPNNVVDIKVNAISNTQKDNISVCPIFDFKNNQIDAKHSVNIGTINLEELDYLLSRNVSLVDAKSMLIDSKLNVVLKYCDDQSLKKYQKIIQDFFKE